MENIPEDAGVVLATGKRGGAVNEAESKMAGYLRDHLAASLRVCSVLDGLARRAFSLELHRFFVRLQVETNEDPVLLKKLLASVEQGVGDAKLSEKRNGQEVKLQREEGMPAGRNPELFAILEWLSLGMEGKALLWRTLRAVSSGIPAWREVDFSGLENRAQNQRDRVETVRMEVAAAVLRGD